MTVVLAPVFLGVLPSSLTRVALSLQPPVLRGILAGVLPRLRPGILSCFRLGGFQRILPRVLPHVYCGLVVVPAGLLQVLPDLAVILGRLMKILQGVAPRGVRQPAVPLRLLHVTRASVLPGVAQLTHGQAEVLSGVAVQAAVLQLVLPRVEPEQVGLPPVLPRVQSSPLAHVLP